MRATTAVRGACAAVLVIAASCRPAQRVTKDTTALEIAPSSSAAAARRAPMPAGAVSAPAVRVGLELVAAPNPGFRQLYVVSAELGLRELIAEPPDRFWCVGRTREHVPQENMGIHIRSLSFGCDPRAEPPDVARIEDNKTLFIKNMAGTERQFTLPAGGDFDPSLPAPPKVDPSTCPARKVHAVIEQRPARVSADDSPVMQLRIPELSFVVPWGAPEDLLSCESLVFAAAHRQEIYCSFSQGSWYKLRLSARNGFLFVTENVHYEASDPHERPRGALVLPCGASVSFADYTSFTDGPDPRKYPECKCLNERRACQWRCFEQMTDAEGELTNQGHECIGQCDRRYEQCDAARGANHPLCMVHWHELSDMGK
jgi:hypothetical protein